MLPDDDLPVPEHDPDSIRDAAERILSGEEFQDNRSLLQRFADWLSDRLADLLGGLDGSGTGLGLLGTIVQLLLLALAVGVLAFAARALIRARRGRVGIDGQELTVVLGVPGDPGELSRQVAAAEAAGEWKAALLARFRLIVATLVADGVLAGVAGRTTGEYRREFGEIKPEHSSTFGAATRAFEAAYYGDVEVGPGDVDDMRARSMTLIGEGERAGAPR